jgi:hypothetical protein
VPEIYTRVTEAASPVLEGLMGALELRAADPQLRVMLTTYLTDVSLPQGLACSRWGVAREQLLVASQSGPGCPPRWESIRLLSS